MDLIDSYITKCNEKIEYHKINSNNARLWKNFINTGTIVVSSVSSLLMTVFSAVKIDYVGITITSAVLFFILTIMNKISSEYNFLSLCLSHNYAMDSYADVKYELEKIKNFESLENNNSSISVIILKYEAVVKQNHLQEVKWCFVSCCCF